LTPNPVSSDKAEIQTILTQHKLDSMTSFVSGNDTGKYVYNGNGNDNGIKPDIHLPDKVIKHTDDVTNVPLNLGDVDVPPECLNLQQVKATLVYPPMAKDIGKTGKVNVKILVGTDGKVIKIADINGPDVFYDEVKEKVMNLNSNRLTRKQTCKSMGMGTLHIPASITNNLYFKSPVNWGFFIF